MATNVSKIPSRKYRSYFTSPLAHEFFHSTRAVRTRIGLKWIRKCDDRYFLQGHGEGHIPTGEKSVSRLQLMQARVGRQNEW
jgi:hypothetical protein